MLLGRRLDQLDIRRNGWDNLFATEDKRELAEQLLNHLDKKGCDALMEILSHRRGGIIYVSHQDLVREGNMSTVFFFCRYSALWYNYINRYVLWTICSL